MILNSGHTPGPPREFEEHEAQTADQVLSGRGAGTGAHVS